MALLKADRGDKITMQKEKNRINNHANTFRITVSLTSKPSQIVT